MSFARVSIVGNLTRDPEVRHTPQGSTTIRFTIAADGRKRGEGTTFFSCTAWDRLAERLIGLQEKGYLSKGSQLYVDGQLESRQYTDKNNQQRTSLDVNVSDFQFVGGGGQQQQSPQQAAPAYGGYGYDADDVAY